MSKSSALLILAAGASKRMGSPKQLLPIKDQVLLTLVVQQALLVPNQDVYVVLGAYASEIEQYLHAYKVRVLHHKNWENGIGSSIAYGVSQIYRQKKYEQAMLILADQPTIVASELIALLGFHQQRKNRITLTDCKNYRGVPAVFAKEVFADLCKLNNDEGAKAVVNMYANKVDYFVLDREILDVDTPEDYQKITKQLNL
ncbi:nucleotidyltransferase family protein [Ochrovirga pacifica]|uniref:nucleotidyltransferase family protein n=1 Tax=Ochrovirga pacifica TaxID=1042376 RepID=UPI000255A83F|nr:nucleotidyltransferase family protein [Ochrovirga pacifica]